MIALPAFYVSANQTQSSSELLYKETITCDGHKPVDAPLKERLNVTPNQNGDVSLRLRSAGMIA